MKPKLADIAIALGAAICFALALPAEVRAAPDLRAHCEVSRSCQIKDITIDGPWFIDIVVDNGEPNTPGVLWAAYDSQNKVVCGGVDKLDENGHLAKSFPCNASGVSPYVAGGGFAAVHTADWHVGYHR
ncbi:hypothetical protein ACIBG0_38400 [Nocardia sp. NPDC050630]|uniref:hypothetical protein n=1 Tax=Nocardia sp. NPDC050630 TaxID=3364321 RepID=UPI0037A1D49E